MASALVLVRSGRRFSHSEQAASIRAHTWESKAH